MKANALVVLLLSVMTGSVLAESNDVEYFAVFMEGSKVGHAIHTRRLEDGKVITNQEFDITVNRLGIPLNIKTTETAIETTDGRPIGFMLEQDLGMMAMKTLGTVEGGTVKITTGSQQQSSFDWPAGAVMPEGFRRIALEKGLKQGIEYDVRLFSSGIMQAVDVHVRVGAKQDVDLLGRIVSLTEVQSTLSMPGMGQIVSVSYVDDDFTELKSTTPMAGMVLELLACTREFAMSENSPVDLINKMFLDSPEPLGDMSSAKSAAYYLSPVSGAGDFSIPSTDSQRVQKTQDGAVVVAVEPAAAPKGVRFPYKGRDPLLLEATKPTRFLESDNEKVIALARQAVGSTKDAAEAAKRIEAFVADYIDDIGFSVGYGSAAEVAQSRQGDCSEFAVLTAAMCRAVGIPARVVVGVAYVGQLPGLEGFGGHAWTEAYVGDRWVGLDAAFKSGGYGGFDAGHIALAMGNGEPGDFFNLATTLGRFEITKAVVNR